MAEVTQNRVRLLHVRATPSLSRPSIASIHVAMPSLGLLRPLTNGAHQPDALGGCSVRRLEIAGAAAESASSSRTIVRRAERSPLAGERLGPAQQPARAVVVAGGEEGSPAGDPQLVRIVRIYELCCTVPVRDGLLEAPGPASGVAPHEKHRAPSSRRARTAARCLLGGRERLLEPPT